MPFLASIARGPPGPRELGIGEQDPGRRGRRDAKADRRRTLREIGPSIATASASVPRSVSFRPSNTNCPSATHMRQAASNLPTDTTTPVRSQHRPDLMTIVSSEPSGLLAA